MAKSEKARIAVIGGSGLYDMEGLKDVREVRPKTPFGTPSDALMIGTLFGQRVAFLSRHGRNHRINPSAINYRGNIYALKSVGVSQVFSVSAVGSMKEHIKPGDMVLPDQFIDRTRLRENTFFDREVVAHVPFSDPICPKLATRLLGASSGENIQVHQGGTYVCIEGPQFSTRAESNMYRQWGVHVIGMTNIPEAKLAREAEMCYATLALVTDYDCWHETEESVSVGGILDIMHRNVTAAKRLLQRAISETGECGTCECDTALDHAIVTPRKAISQSAQRRLGLLLKRQISTGMGRKRSK